MTEPPNAAPGNELERNLVESWLRAEAQAGRDAEGALAALNASTGKHYRPSNVEVWRRGEQVIPAIVQLCMLKLALRSVLKAAGLAPADTPELQHRLNAVAAALAPPRPPALRDAPESAPP